MSATIEACRHVAKPPCAAVCLALGVAVWAGWLGACQSPKPPTPTGEAILVGDAQVTLNWTSDPGVRYDLYWTQGRTLTRETGIHVADVSSPYGVSGLSNGSSYQYFLTAVTGSGESDPTLPLWGTPAVTSAATPASITVQPGASGIAVSWSSVAGAASYVLYADDGSNALNTGVPGATSPYTQSLGPCAATYRFEVTAVTGGVESPPSPNGGVTISGQGTQGCTYSR